MKTKTKILIMFAIIFVCGRTSAQEDLPYRSFQKFNKDTIRYLDYNFKIRKEQYSNKTVGELLSDLEISVIYISEVLMEQASPSGIDIRGMRLIFRLNGDGRDNNVKDYYISIFLKTVISGVEFVTALSSDKRNTGREYFYYWTPELHKLLKDSKLEYFNTNDRLFEDRLSILENSENEEQSSKELKKIIESEKTRWRKIIQAEKQEVKK